MEYLEDGTTAASQGSISLTLRVWPPQLSPASPIPSPPPPRMAQSMTVPSCPGGNQTVLQHATQSDFKSGMVRQSSSLVACQLSNPA